MAMSSMSHIAKVNLLFAAAWAGPMRPPWPPQAIAVTPQGSAFGHTVGPLTEPHRLPGELEPPACRWMASANSALAEMFPGR